MSTATYQRQWRASKGARTGAPGPRPVQPCGTPAAYKRHKRRGEDACEACTVVEAERQHELYRQRRDRQRT